MPGYGEAALWPRRRWPRLQTERKRATKAARAEIARANRADPDNPLPLLAYYRSLAEAGEAPPDIAIEGLMKVVDTVPTAPGPRLLLGGLVRRGNTAAARRALCRSRTAPMKRPNASAQAPLRGDRTS